MSAPRDKFGRPIVVVTGMGVVTSLGAGKTDNWAQADRGRIRHPDRDALSDRRPEDDDGRHGRFRHRRAVLVDRPDRAAGRDRDRGSARAGRHRRQGRFPGPLFLAVAPVEVEWPQRLELGRAVGKTEFGYDDMLRVSGGGRFAQYHHRFMFGSVAEPSGRNIRHQGIADFAFDGLRLRRDRDPARRRGDPPRRSRRRAVRRRPTARSIRKRWCGSRCCRRCRPRTIRRRPPQSRSRRTATVL